LIGKALESFKWNFLTKGSHSPVMVDYIYKGNKALGQKQWFIDRFFGGHDSSKPNSIQAFWLLLIHLISSGNPSGDVPAELGKAWGVDKKTVWNLIPIFEAQDDSGALQENTTIQILSRQKGHRQLKRYLQVSSCRKTKQEKQIFFTRYYFLRRHPKILQKFWMQASVTFFFYFWPLVVEIPEEIF
jgi:hypothetical protein